MEAPDLSPEVLSLIRTTADYVARIGPEFEAQALQAQAQNPALSFLNHNDPLHGVYLEYMRESVKKYKPTAEPAPSDTPPDHNPYAVEHPVIAQVDMDVIKLVAQFVARNGQEWLVTLSESEAGNPQFDFLTPSHTLFPYFTALVDAYTHCLVPSDDALAQLQRYQSDYQRILADCLARTEQARKEAVEQAVAEQEDNDPEILASIDWHDFVVVETISFNDLDLPTDQTPRLAEHRTDVTRELQEYTQQCPTCRQMIPIKDFSEHVRLELMDSGYKVSRANADSRAKDVYAGDAEMLRNFERMRPTVVEEVTASAQYLPDPSTLLMSEAEWIRRHPGLLTVTLSLPEGGAVSLSLRPTATIDAVKEAIMPSLYGIPKTRVKLRTDLHTVLKDELTLAYYNIGDG